MLRRKLKVAALAVAAGVFTDPAQASVIHYDMNNAWAIAHPNAPAVASDGTLNAGDGHDLELRQQATAAPATTIDLADAVGRGDHALYTQAVPPLDKRVREPYRTVIALAKAIP